MARGTRKVRDDPRISVNKLGEYIVSRANRQARILSDQKSPSAFQAPYYQPAQDAISSFLAGNMEDLTRLVAAGESLNQQKATTVWATRRAANNVDAIDAFINMIDDIDLLGAEIRLGAQTGATITIASVEVSVRPEIVLTGTGRQSGALVGGAKLYFPRAFPLSEEMAGYISTMLYMYANDRLYDDGTAHPPYCQVIDVASQRIWPGATPTKQRKRDIESACAQIAALWPTIKV